MTDTNIAIVPVATPTVKAVKPAIKAVKTVKPAKKSTKPAKKAAKKVAARKAEQAARKSNVFTATAKVAKETFTGQKMAIVKALGKNGATRADLIAKLPNISAANISWYLSNLVGNGLVKKTAQK